MFGSDLSHCVEVYLRTCIGHIKQEVFCEGTVLNVFQNLLHCLLRFFGDDLRTSDIVAIFSRVGDGVSHPFETTLVDKVYDQLHFVDTFEVSVSRVVTSFGQGFETSLHQCAYTAAKNCLFAEKVGFGFRTEVRFQNACSCTADTKRISKTDIQSVTRCILFDCNQARNTLTNLIFASYRMTRALGSNHDNVNVLRGFDATEVNVETVSKCKRLTFGKVGFDAFFVKLRLLFIVDQNHDKVSNLCCFRCGHNRQALLFSLCPALAAFIKTNHYFYTRILKVERVSVTLRAVTDDGYRFASKFVKIAILLIVNFTHNSFSFLSIKIFFFFVFIVCPMQSQGEKTYLFNKVTLPLSKATIPVRHISIMPKGCINATNASIFWGSPVTSIHISEGE